MVRSQVVLNRHAEATRAGMLVAPSIGPEPEGDSVIVNRRVSSGQPDEYDELEQHLTQ